MKKTYADIIAGLIPHQMTQNRWRGLLRYGPINAMKLRRMLKREEATPPQYYLAICAIVKNEGAYLQEWIEWHKKTGAEKFYIYDNESTDNTKEVLAPYIESGLVEYTLQPGKKQMFPAYDDCLEKHRLHARWIAFIDLDEFIVPIKDKTIPEFLKRFENFPAVEINWLIYGSGGAKTKEAGGVMERFKCHAAFDNVKNRYVKTIADPRRVYVFISSHKVAAISKSPADSHGNRIKKNYKRREPLLDVIRVNHYVVKSYEEFVAKRARGDVVSLTTSRLNLDSFYWGDLNDVREE